MLRFPFPFLSNSWRWLTLTCWQWGSQFNRLRQFSQADPKHAVTKENVNVLFLAVQRANLLLEHCIQSCLCDFLEHVQISAICPGICQNSPNPFPPPPTALNRREEERRGYRKKHLEIALENSNGYLDFTVKGTLRNVKEWMTSAVILNSDMLCPLFYS